MRRFELAVIGGGPAGMAAALEAREQGVRDIIVLEREPELGGILQQCIHSGFGLKYFNEELTGPEYAERFMDRLGATDIVVKTDTTALEISRDRRVKAVNPEDGYFEIEADALILATGCRERTREAVGIPGDRPAGVYTAGSAQRFINQEGYIIGRRALILGSGDVGLIMARRLTLEGCEVIAVAEARPAASGLKRNVRQCLDDFGIPLLLSHTVTSILGKDRLEGVVLSEVDENLQPLPGKSVHVACDTLLLSVGLIPETELAVLAGIPVHETQGGLLVNENLQCGVEGIFACGNAVRIYDLADTVSLQGQLAGRSAADFIFNHRSTASAAQDRNERGLHHE
ncbi:FAD-dependent oxidoreductase [Paenibacillus sp. HN-1]|uniref:NAD(P)/FAD-dependent oxidoreductase n=1 Tax=Paenibacillus TaxID=44249 RepID=UPI001CA8CEF6|nr:MULTISPECIES: FAD-dependent oxidoreductase [Paenibacillus]MBY9081481.1 FAD-dependent oxidoreductase [Paenibacillus sp. CGMCC 1.18879]MBY9085001.1 FAD-dependent oxidoreductase [Paenibacillus sinensis]